MPCLCCVIWIQLDFKLFPIDFLKIHNYHRHDHNISVNCAVLDSEQTNQYQVQGVRWEDQSGRGWQEAGKGRLTSECLNCAPLRSLKGNDVHASRRHQGQHKSKSCRLVSIVVLAGACDLWGSGVRGGVCLTSGVIRLMVGKSYPAPRKFGA